MPAHRRVVHCIVVLLMANQLSAAQRLINLSDVLYANRVTGGFGYLKWERLDIYDRDSSGKDIYVGTVRSGPPGPAITSLGGGDLTQKQFALAADGHSIVFLHRKNMAPRGSHLEGGIYIYRHGGSLRMLHPDSEAGFTWTLWPKPIPSDVLPFNHPTAKHVVWAVTPAGNEFPLALLNGEKLHDAALDGRTEECVSLIKQGASVNATTYWGFTPLELAIIADHEDTAIQLLQLGADSGAGTYPPLHEAVELGRLRVVEAMLAKGVNVNALDSYGNSALHLAGHLPQGRFGDFGLFFDSDSIETPKSLIDKHVITPLIRLLLDHGANANLPDRMGKIPVDYTSTFMPPEAKELLLAASKKN